MATKKKAAKKTSGAKRKLLPKGVKITHTAKPPKITIYIEDKNYYKVTVDRIKKGIADERLEMRCFWDGSQWICS